MNTLHLDCAKTGKTAEQCGDLFIEEAMGYMTTIVDGIHKANPEAQVRQTPFSVWN